MTDLFNSQSDVFIKFYNFYNQKFLSEVKKALCMVFFLQIYYDAVFSFCRLHGQLSRFSIECFHSRGQHLCKYVRTKENVCIRKEFNSQRTGLGHQHGRRFIVLGHQYGRRDVM